MPKILGTYENELHDTIGNLPRFSIGFDVGAAEGYYAVGLLRSGLCDKMVAWETTTGGRNLLKELAGNNRVSNSLDIRGECSAEALAAELREHGSCPNLLLVDCEGFEGPLLESIPIEQFGNSTLIIETHDALNPGVHCRLLEKFHTSHEVSEIVPAKRKRSDLDSSLPSILRIFRLPGLGRTAMSERRCPDIKWLVCCPKAGKLP